MRPSRRSVAQPHGRRRNVAATAPTSSADFGRPRRAARTCCLHRTSSRSSGRHRKRRGVEQVVVPEPRRGFKQQRGRLTGRVDWFQVVAAAARCRGSASCDTAPARGTQGAFRRPSERTPSSGERSTGLNAPAAGFPRLVQRRRRSRRTPRLRVPASVTASERRPAKSSSTSGCVSFLADRRVTRRMPSPAISGCLSEIEARSLLPQQSSESPRSGARRAATLAPSLLKPATDLSPMSGFIDALQRKHDDRLICLTLDRRCRRPATRSSRWRSPPSPECTSGRSVNA